MEPGWIKEVIFTPNSQDGRIIMKLTFELFTSFKLLSSKVMLRLLEPMLESETSIRTESEVFGDLTLKSSCRSGSGVLEIPSAFPDSET